MTELTSTRQNHMIDPVMHVWGWEIPIYLFLGGFVAGMMIISGYLLWRGRHRNLDSACLMLPGISLVLLTVGMVALFLDLEHKRFVWRLYTTFQVASPMSWGAWILILVYPALLANLMLGIPAPLGQRFPKLQEMSDALRGHRSYAVPVGIANMVLGGLLGTYTGILLSSLGARPLWNTPILGMLFLVSGLSGAAAFVHLVASDPDERELMAKSDNGFLVVELFVIGMLLIWLVSSTDVYMRAAWLLLGGPYTAVFWVFVVLVGIVVPLIYQSLAVTHRVPHCWVMPVLVIAGGVVLRFVIVSAGQHSHWMMSALH